MAHIIFLLVSADPEHSLSYPTQGVRRLRFHPPISIEHWLSIAPWGINSPVFQSAHAPESSCSQRRPWSRVAGLAIGSQQCAQEPHM